MKSRLHVPLLKPEGVIPHLGSPTHWKQGRSAKSLADRWFQANDLPPPVRAALDQALEFVGAELVDAWLERCTDLQDGRASPSQTDLLAIIGLASGIGVLGIEAKVTESFGERVTDWLADGSEGKQKRLAKLCELFGVSANDVGGLRYQLFHRTAAVVIEARRYRADKAAMIVQSFCADPTGFGDFAEFCARVGFGPVAVGGLTQPRVIDGVSLRLGWVADEPPPEGRKRRSVEWLTEYGRTRLSKSFFMRDFLFSDIAAVHGFTNIPDDPELAVAAGRRLCEELLEPLQERFGRVAIRSAYRSAEVNGFGNRMQRKKVPGYSCASNEANAAGHIWDLRDAEGCMGATACIVVPSFWDRFHDEEGGWRRLAWWIHDRLPYSSLYFFPKYWAFNISWHERPERRIDSYVAPAGCLTKPGMANHEGGHEAEWGVIFD